MTGRYINPFTDFGFKKLFGEISNNELLLDFLNSLLMKYTGEIKFLRYLKKEQLGRNIKDRKAVYDLYCENEKGEKFIIEIQQAKINYFKERMIYYSTFPIQEQARAGEWDFNLKAIYAIGILDFTFDDKNDRYRKDIRFMDVETCEEFSDKLTFICLEMPKFNKTLDELETKFDKWLYVLKNLTRLEDIPNKLRESIFEKFFHEAKIANLTGVELEEYEIATKVYLDNLNAFRTAESEGEEKGFVRGREDAKRETALNLLSMGLDTRDISKATGLSIEEIEKLRK